jgi:CelD/BcsL family acetyltransferase involved in cellulose biosynthesis/ribosomal protein S18 acetylase RimI-like enzyme
VTSGAIRYGHAVSQGEPFQRFDFVDPMTSQTVASSPAATLLVYSDEEALRLIGQQEFQADWKALADKCPWATALQSPEFGTSWYQCYEGLYRPLILVRYSAEGQIDGLIALAVEQSSGKLVLCGAHQAEYQVWLALPGEQTFITEVLERLRRLGFSSISFTYLPPTTPLEWLKENWIRKSAIRKVARPLLAVDNADAVSESLGKKKNRRRLEKLQADGPLTFLELHSPAELEAYYDEIIDFYDFRMGAIHGKCPFREDERKRTFYRSLMAKGGLLHVTAMKIGQQLIAAHIGMRNKSEVTLGIVGHSPFMAIHSPGKLLILQLGLLLHEQGFSSLDLTPGGDAYKEDRATTYDEAHLLTVFLSNAQLIRHKLLDSVRIAAEQIAIIFRIDKRTLSRWRSFANKPSASLASLPLTSVRNRVRSSEEEQVYCIETAKCGSIRDDQIHRDNLNDILRYDSSNQGSKARQIFFSNALTKIESGAHFYSIIRDQLLVGYGWLISKSDPLGAVVIEQVWVEAAYRRLGIGSSLLRQMWSDAAAMEGAKRVCVTVSANDQPALSMLRKLGFQCRSGTI